MRVVKVCGEGVYWRDKNIERVYYRFEVYLLMWCCVVIDPSLAHSPGGESAIAFCASSYRVMIHFNIPMDLAKGHM